MTAVQDPGALVVPGSLYCPRCEAWKTCEDFGRASRRPTGRQLWCRACKASYDRALYQQPHRKRSIQANNKARAVENAKRVFLYLLAHPCQDCGEGDPVVLEFDHVSGEKASSIANMIRGGAYRWATIEAEMKKCIVRCANCHRRRTADQLGYHGWLAEPAIGVEPMHSRLRIECSTTELRRQVEQLRNHFGLTQDGEFRNQTAINQFLIPATLHQATASEEISDASRSITNRELYP